jgi:ferritin-like metal-binding protein YciE
MSESTIQEMLVSYVRDAHAMEESVLKMLDSMIATTKDEQILAELRKHRTETEQHEQRLAQRLEAMGAGTSALKDISATFGALAKGMIDVVRSHKPAKNARDAYVTEAMEIAAYRLLEELAVRAGDEETADVARANCRDEVAMRDIIDSNWGRFVDLTLQEEHVEVGAS